MRSSSRRWSVYPLFLIPLLLFAACSEDANVIGGGDDDISGTETLATIDIDQEYGGLSFTDESEAFGDAELSALAVSEELALAEDDEDSLCDRDPALRGPRFQRTHVRILWGQLDGDYDATASVSADQRMDWTGTASVTGGVIFMKRTLLFEYPADHRLPRTDRSSVGWVSHTGPHMDGVLVTVATRLPDANGDSSVADLPEPMFTFATGPYTVSFSLSELDGLDHLETVDDQGNAVSIIARTVRPDECAEGFLMGFWKNGEDNPDTDAVEMGGFRGMYVSADGFLHGFVMGRYGVNTEGENVFAGKYVGRFGKIRGLMRGSWTPDSETDGVGSFRGSWVGRFGNHMGTLQGKYRAHEAEGRGDGYFRGLWKESCVTAP